MRRDVSIFIEVGEESEVKARKGKGRFQRGTMACVSENSGDDGRYLNSDHPGWRV